ncbi:MAG TPA: EamA family transporter [Candidatus Dormibacteraeota bacterium]
MIPVALALVLGAAGMHAAWNVMLKGSADPLRLSLRALVMGNLLFAPVVFGVWLLTGRPGLQPAGWLCVAGSAVAELFYFVFLSHAYRRGELSFVYPIARGTGPLIAVAGGLLLLREQLGFVQLAGVAALLAGIWLVRRPSGASGPLGAALLTGLCIGTYTLIDRVGVRLGPPWLYGWLMFMLTCGLLAAWVAVFGGAGSAPGWRRSTLVGVLMSATFYVVLIALAIAPVTVVAPARESAIVLVSAWGVLRLRERQGLALKLVGAAAILAGVVLLIL